MHNGEERLLRQVTQKLRNRVTRAVPIKLKQLRLSAPVASFTFDDFAKSAWQTGGPLVEAYGGRATYYMAGKLCRERENGILCFDEDDLAAVVRNGHDVGCHTFDHFAIPHYSSAAIGKTISGNLAYLARITGRTSMTSFAYPFGAASIRTKFLLKHRFLACRGIYPGINAGWTDFSQLNALSLHRSGLPIKKYMESARRHCGWLIFIGHDVSDRPSPFGCTPQVLETALRLVSDAGIEILTMDAALKRILGQNAAADSPLSISIP